MTTALILAGGLGTRLRSTVPDLPKPMAPVEGRPFLEHLLDHWISEGIDRFILSVGFRREAIIGHFGNRYRGIPLEYVIESEPLGTGGAMLLAIPRLSNDERFILLNGDTYFAVSLESLLQRAASTDSDWCFSLFAATEPGRFMGLEIDGGGLIKGLQHENQRIGRLANGGVYAVHPRQLSISDIAAGGPISLENDLFPLWLAKGHRFFGLPVPAPFIDIGVPHDYHRASDVLPSPRTSPDNAGSPKGVSGASAPQYRRVH